MSKSLPKDYSNLNTIDKQLIIGAGFAGLGIAQALQATNTHL